MTTKKFQKIVWDYYKGNGRHSLPWRINLDPYAIVVSEVMLQQTQVDRVVPKFEQWLVALPTWQALAAAPTAQVLTLWQGLGYNRRALALARCAQMVVKKYAGELPRTESELVSLPGIGPYTAGAVRAFAFNEPVVMIETNIRAVFIHHFFSPPAFAKASAGRHPQPLSSQEERGNRKVDDLELVPIIQKTLDRNNPREWYWALMDYGVYIKKTFGNPARRSAHHTRQSTFEGSHRQVRGAVLRALTQQPFLSEKSLANRLQKEGIAPNRMAPALQQLEHEGFIARDSRRKKIALRQ